MAYVTMQSSLINVWHFRRQSPSPSQPSKLKTFNTHWSLVIFVQNLLELFNSMRWSFKIKKLRQVIIISCEFRPLTQRSHEPHFDFWMQRSSHVGPTGGHACMQAKCRAGRLYIESGWAYKLINSARLGSAQQAGLSQTEALSRASCLWGPHKA